jgi:hypothetical protein
MDGIVLRIICSTGSLSSEPIKHYVKYCQEALAILPDKQPHRGRRLKESDDESSQDRYTEDRTAEDEQSEHGKFENGTSQDENSKNRPPKTVTNKSASRAPSACRSK